MIMKGQTVEQSDLIGEIKDFPIEVVQEMVNEQVMQGNNADVVVFQDDYRADKNCGGFCWCDSVMGADFWYDVLYCKRFDIFFQKYPKNKYVIEKESISIKVPDGYEIDRKKSTSTNIVFKPIACKCPKSWEDAFIGNPIRGYWVNSASDIIRMDDRAAVSADKNVFKTEKQAKSALAYAQITQLMALHCYNGDWTPDWENGLFDKYSLIRKDNAIELILRSDTFSPITFKSKEAQESFLKNHEDLLRQYFQMD